jgi:methanethiol S-methyltransferase
MTASFWIILLAVIVYGGLHSWMASLSLKQRLNARFGSKVERVYRLVYNVVAVITLLPVLILPIALMDKPIYQIPLSWMILSLLGQAVSALVVVVGIFMTGFMKFLGICQLVRCEGDEPPRLVVTGLYRWVRHPLYTASLLFIWLMPVMTWNLLALNLGLTLYIVIGTVLEERKLLAEFGEEYASYVRRTPMLIPGLKPDLVMRRK